MGVVMSGVRRLFEGRSEPVVALDGVDLEITAGEVHGLLGPNGAGKTTTVRILSTLLLPTSGSASVDGVDVVDDPVEVRRRIGLVLGGERGLHGRLTARENLRYAGVLQELSRREAARRADELTERVGLAGRADDRVETFSRGMKQRVHLARGLMGDPSVVFLDEPTSGLDPVAALEFRGLVRQLADEGRTVLLTTHDMAEAERVCDRVSLLSHGRLLATETPEALGRMMSRYDRIQARVADPAAVVGRIGAMAGVRGVEVTAEGVRVETDGEQVTNAVLGVLVAAGATWITTSRPSLQEVYLYHFGAQGMRV